MEKDKLKKVVKNALKINQDIFNKESDILVLNSSLKSKELFEMFKLTERTESIHQNYEDEFLGEQKINESEIEFQRHINPTRISKMRKYLLDEKSDYPSLFPTSLLIWLDCEKIEKLESKDYFENYCYYDEEESKLEIKFNKRVALIVDGQHRITSLKEIHSNESQKIKSKIEEFEFPVTFLIGGDIFFASQIFAKVNFEQKPVNRSIYYDIFGSIPGDKSVTSFAHRLVVYLNNSDNSVLKNKIKLLGKGEGLISQSFLIRKILPFLNKGNIWREYYLDFVEGGTSAKKITQFIRIYFNSIAETYNGYWVDPSSNKPKGILAKTTGLGAFIILTKDFFKIVENYNDEKDIKIEIISRLQKLDNQKREKCFSLDGDYGSAGSDGLQSRLALYLKKEFQFELNQKEKERYEKNFEKS